MSDSDQETDITLITPCESTPAPAVNYKTVQRAREMRLRPARDRVRKQPAEHGHSQNEEAIDQRFADRRMLFVLEPKFRDMFAGICRQENKRPTDVIAMIDQMREGHCRASAIKVFILNYYRLRAAADCSDQKFSDYRTDDRISPDPPDPVNKPLLSRPY